MITNQKIEWKMVEVDGFEVENTLSLLTDSEYEIFTVQFTGEKWSIIARKFIKDSSGKNSIGFGK